MRTNVLIATLGVTIFALVTLTSGRVDVREGLGWDGAAYAQMVTGSLSDGSPNTMVRPLVALAVRVPYAVGVDVIRSFQIINYLSAFVLYLFVCLLLQREGAGTPIRTVLTANLACCIATSKMFAYYPVLIDFGALAVTTAAFYLVRTDQRRAASVTTALAVASREFGIAVALYGVHRSIRTGRPWRETAAVYLPAFVTLAAIRIIAIRVAAADDTPLSLGDAAGNLSLWTSPAFIAFFVYFAVVVFGGISAMLAVRLRRCVQRLRAEPELGTFTLLIVAAAAGGSLDIWRYLAFSVPVAVVLAGDSFRRTDEAFAYRALLVMSLITILTQRPFETITTTTYFRDWFPLYEYFDPTPTSGDLIEIWRTRMASLVLLLFALWLLMRRTSLTPSVPVVGSSPVQSQPPAW